jgi:hypothetical protein
MSPQRVRFEAFAPDQVASLQQAFQAAWAVLKPHKLAPDKENEKKVELADCLIALAEKGITDPDELKRRAIEIMFIGTG